jgi:ribosome-associated protein
MSKKKQVFLWVRDDIAEEEEEETDLSDEERRPERSEHRSQMADLKALANRLALLSPGQRRNLPLETEVLDQLDLLAAANLRPDRRRVLMRTKTLLGTADLEKLVAALEGDTPAALLDRELVYWRGRILQGDDQVIQAFMEKYPQADRQAIRNAAREARKANANAALSRLLQLLRDAAAALSPIENEDEDN